jgi:hypothetical protein
MPWSTAISAAAGKVGALVGSELGDLWADIWDLSDEGRRNSRAFFGMVTGGAAGAVVGYAMLDPYGAHAGGAMGAASVDFDVVPDHGSHHDVQFGNLPDKVDSEGHIVYVPTMGPEIITEGPNKGQIISDNATYPKPSA